MTRVVLHLLVGLTTALSTATLTMAATSRERLSPEDQLSEANAALRENYHIRRHFERGESTEKGCILDSAAYQHEELAKDRCIYLQCLNGIWKYFAIPNRYAGWNLECNHCYTFGHTDINMFEEHDIANSKFKHYHVGGNGTYAFSQLGITIPSNLIMETTFDYFEPEQTHTTKVIYKEVGIEVELVFPSPSQYAYCDAHPNHPDCEAKLSVNDVKITLGSDFGSVATFYGVIGTVFIINNGHTWPFTKQWGHFYVVGSQGTSVRIDYGDWYAVHAVSMVMPSLKNKVYGLCDVWDGTTQTGFTMSNDGGVTTDKNEFVNSWLIQ